MVSFATVLVAALAGAVSAVGIGRDPGTLLAIRAEGDKPMEGLDSKCNKWHRVVKGDTCEAIVKLTSINLEDFLKWNPKITKACKEILLGYDVCVGVSGTPAASGTNSPTSKPPVSSSTPAPTSNAGSSPPAAKPSTASSNGAQPSCKGHSYVPKSGDTCSKIQAQYTNINLSQFYKDYTAVGSNCAGLQASQTYCFPTATHAA